MIEPVPSAPAAPVVPPRTAAATVAAVAAAKPPAGAPKATASAPSLKQPARRQSYTIIDPRLGGRNHRGRSDLSFRAKHHAAPRCPAPPAADSRASSR